MKDLYKSIGKYSPGKKIEVLMVFNDMTAVVTSNKKLHPVVNELFNRGRKLNISLVVIRQSYFLLPKDVRLSTTHFFIMKIRNRQELQQIVINDSSDTDCNDFKRLYRKCTADPYSFLVIDTTLPLGNPLHFQNNLLESV